MQGIQKLVKLIFVSIVLIRCFLTAADIYCAEKQIIKLTQAEKLRLEIRASIKRIKDKSKKAGELFQEAKIEADNLKAEAEEKLNYLKGAIEKAQTLEYINKTGLQKAVKLKKQAEELFKQYEYLEVIKIVKQALLHISKVPIVSIKVIPQIFSPDGDGKNDVLKITPDIFSVTKISRWIGAVRKKEKGEKKEIELKTWRGDGNPPEVIEWDGKIGDSMAVDSASSYLVELIVVDENNAVVSSGKIKFKTDIFANETKRGLLIDISSIIFAYNSAFIESQYKGIIKMVYDFLLRYPEYSVAIEGHTDSSGPAYRNKTLSEKRAQSVADYLIELGMNKEKLQVYGLGEVLPKTYDSSKMGLNRRVTFILLKTKDDIFKYKHYIKKFNFNKEIKMK